MYSCCIVFFSSFWFKLWSGCRQGMHCHHSSEFRKDARVLDSTSISTNSSVSRLSASRLLVKLHYVYSILSANNNHHEQNNSYYSIPYSCQDSISMSHPGYNTPSMLQTGNSSPRFCSMSSWSSHRTLPVDV